jgi:hypothetical protein
MSFVRRFDCSVSLEWMDDETGVWHDRQLFSEILKVVEEQAHSILSGSYTRKVFEDIVYLYNNDLEILLGTYKLVNGSVVFSPAWETAVGDYTSEIWIDPESSWSY